MINTKVVLGITLAGLVSVQGSLIGTSVTGSVRVGGAPENLFDPVHGFGGGFLNATGTTVIVSNPATEFGYAEPFFTLVTANFTGNQLFVSETIDVLSPEIRMTFQNSAFTGALLSEFSDSFINGGAGGFIIGDTLTIDLPQLFAPGSFSIIFNIATPNIPATPNVPDGGMTLGMLALGAVGLFAMRRRVS